MFRKIFDFVRRLFRPEPEPTTPAKTIDPAEKIRNGRHAEALLNDPMLVAVFDAVAHQYRAEWEKAAPGDFEKQRIAHSQITALKDVLRTIRSHLTNSKMWQADLEARQRREAEKYPY